MQAALGAEALAAWAEVVAVAAAGEAQAPGSGAQAEVGEECMERAQAGVTGVIIFVTGA